MKDILKKIATQIIIPLVVAYGTFLFTKKKYDTGVQSSQIENVKATIGIYKAMAMDIREELLVQKDRVSELEFEVARLRKNCN